MTDADTARLAEIADALNQIDAYTAEGRAIAILGGLQFTAEMQAAPTRLLSGGTWSRTATQ
eukprot:SAG22_NODE_21252_length_258_cov_1.308176_1_plen_60_part_10